MRWSKELMTMKKIYFIIFVLYILIVLRLTVFRPTTYDEHKLNLSLFTELIKVYQTNTLWQFLRLFLGNIGWFVPFGFLAPMLMKQKKLIIVALCGCGFSFVIEVLQFVFKKGFCEIDDLILNTLGVVIGYGIYVIFSNLKGKCLKKCG